jgi:putative transcriptional regulator
MKGSMAKEKNINSFGNRLAKLRKERGLTQQQLADKVGASRQTIVAIEKGNYSPSLELAFKIAGVFNISINDVFSYEPEVENPKR